MPNWCEGRLKIRGAVKNLMEFLETGTEVISPTNCKEKPFRIIFNQNTGEVTLETKNSCLWIKGAYRNFCYPDSNEWYARKENSIITIVFPFKAAWEIDPDPLKDLSEKYQLDFKIFGIECGMQFCQQIEIISGVITENQRIKYDDWDWECPFPDMGG